MSLAWLLFTRSFRHSWRRFLLLAVALGIGTLLSLLAAAGINGLSNRMLGTSWQQTIIQSSTLPHQQSVTKVEPLYAILSAGSNTSSLWRNKEISVTKIAATNSTSPRFQDMPTPDAGEYYVSPGLMKIIDEHPEDAVGSRFGEKLLGVIPDRYVASPDELSVISGMSLSEAKGLESMGASVMKLYRISPKPAIDPKYSSIIAPTLYLGLFIVLFPIVLLISVATRLGGGQREQRYAALRLIGATKGQMRRIMTVESLAASVAGIAIGLALYIATRSLVLEFRFNGMRFWPHEITIPLAQIGIIIVGILIFATAINWWSMRRIQLSPLGVVRKSILHKQLHWWRLAPLCIGLGVTAYVASPLLQTQGGKEGVAILLIFAGVVVTTFGLLVAGPLITQRLAALIVRYTRRASILLGMKYVAINARGVFRSVSGVVIALFIGSFLLVFANGMQSFMAKSASISPYSQLHPDAALIGTYIGGSNPLPNGQDVTLQGLDYVKAATEVKRVSYSYIVMSCETATEYVDIQCPSDKHYVGVSFDFQASLDNLYGATEADVYELISKDSPYANVSSVVPNYLVQIDNYANIDKLRSFISSHYAKEASTSVYMFDGSSSNTSTIHPIIKEVAELARIGIIVTVFVAIVSLALSSVGRLFEQRHSLTALRLSGMTVARLKLVVIIESLVPLLSVTIMSSSLGIVIGAVLIGRLGLVSSVHDILSTSYLLLLGGCLVASILTNMCVLSFVNKATNPDKMRME